MPRKSTEQEINEFLDIWDCKQINSFFRDVIPLLQLYNVDENHDWLRDIIKAEDLQSVRLARTVYLLSIICENHSGKMSTAMIHHRNLYKRLETIADEVENV